MTKQWFILTTRYLHKAKDILIIALPLKDTVIIMVLASGRQ